MTFLDELYAIGTLTDDHDTEYDGTPRTEELMVRTLDEEIDDRRKSQPEDDWHGLFLMEQRRKEEAEEALEEARRRISDAELKATAAPAIAHSMYAAKSPGEHLHAAITAGATAQDLIRATETLLAKAEALREAADQVDQIDGRKDDAAANWLRARADQIQGGTR